MRKASAGGKRSFTLRAHLLALVFGMLVPALVVAAVLVRRVVDDNRQSVRRQLLEASRAAASLTDAELNGTVRALQALAQSERLTDDDVAGFYLEAKRLQRSQPTWRAVLLHSPALTPVFDTARTFGDEVPGPVDPDTLSLSFKRFDPLIGNLRRGTAGRLAFPVRVPIVRDGRVEYVLTALIDPERFAKVLIEQKAVPQEWVRAVLDRQGMVVVRSRDADRFVGQEATGSFLSQIAQSSEAFYRDVALDGTTVYGAFSRAPVSGWIVAIAVPTALVDASFIQSLVVLGLFGILLIAGGGAGAFMISRRLSGDIARSAASAETLARGERPAFPRSDVYEIQQLNRALAASAHLLDQREHERDEHLARAESARVEAEAADRAKDEFLAMLGHELRNPLAPVLTALQLMQLRGETAGSRERAIIERQVRHLVRLVDDLLDVSRLRRGRIELKMAPLDIRAAIDEAVETSTPVLHARGHRLVVDVAAVGLGVHGDQTRLAQVFVNLLNNAAKYSERPGLIEIAASLDAASGQVVVTCRDEGIGIAPELLPRIFDLFAQGRQSLDRASGGLGLGLAVAKTLVELHGGTISAHSDGVGLGSTFMIRLPGVAVESADEATPRLYPPDLLAGRRVLVVDDNRDAAEMLAQTLGAVGAEVAVESDAVRALAMVESWHPDTVVLDIGLPVMDGFEVARRVRTQPGGAAMRVVAVTGYGQEQDLAASAAAGFDRHLVKPVSVEALFEALER
jgi:signal transduction histidine kinase/CheY-like chemotaxis protein